MYKQLEIKLIGNYGLQHAMIAMRLPMKGKKQDDVSLARKLVRAGGPHAKFSRGIVYWVHATFQVGFMIELDTYRHGREVLSTSSSMHQELKGLSGEELAEKKQIDLPEKQYTQIATYSAQVLRSIYIQRRLHRHPDWQIFCDWIEELPGFHIVIMPEKGESK